jgi:hypothetical protein
MTDQTPITVPAIRRDGWTAERTTQFLNHLANDGSVRAACARVGMSREAAYQLRRRDALFARAWNAALVLAREASAEVLEDRAIHGVVEEIWFRGDLVGTRRKFDSRLLLAHMARLDRIAGEGEAGEDAARFDELLALAGGERPPEELVVEFDEVPITRHMAETIAADMAEDDWREEAALLAPVYDESSEEAERKLSEMRWQVSNEAVAAAGARWDGWFAQACGAVDRLLAAPIAIDPAIPCTVSELSTSPAAGADQATAPDDGPVVQPGLGSPAEAPAPLTGFPAWKARYGVD